MIICGKRKGDVYKRQVLYYDNKEEKIIRYKTGKKFSFSLKYQLCILVCLLYTSSKRVLVDVQKLGADRNYLTGILKMQIKKVFVLPTVIAIVIMFAYYMLVLWQNRCV